MEDIFKKSLWMGSLEPHMTEAVITTAFQKMGEKVVVKFVRDKVTRAWITTYCFVEFVDQEHAENALKNINGKALPNLPQSTFHLAPSRSGSDKESSQGTSRNSADSLFIGGLSEDVEESLLFDFFKSRYSTVKEAKLCKAPDGSSKGFGFVRFFNESDRMEALRRMNGVRGLGTKQIFVSPATPKPSYPRHPKYEQSSSQGWQHQDTDGYYSQQQQQQQHLPGQYQPAQQHHATYAASQSYYGGESWSGQSYQQYQSHYPQTYDYGSPRQSSHGQSTDTQVQAIDKERKEDDELVDQELHYDVDKMNEEFIQNNEELYSSLEKSRWNFVDSITMTVDEISTT